MTATVVTSYLGEGLLAARPATPAVAAGCIAFYYATDTSTTYIYNGTAWSPLVGGIDLFSPPLAATFPTIINGNPGSSAPAVTDTGTYGMLFDSGPTVAGDGIRGAFQPIPSATSFTVIMGVRLNFVAVNYRSLGLCLTDGTKFMLVHQISQNLDVSEYTNSTTFSASPVTITPYMQTVWYFKVVGAGGNLTWSVSSDGRNWVVLYTAAIGAFLSTITKVGIAGDSNASASPPAAGDHIFGDVFYWSATTP